MAGEIKNIVFDLGGVLIHWDPRELYQKIFADRTEMEVFLRDVCNQEWNEKQDAGRSFKVAVDELILKYPEQASAIRAYDERWEEMILGSIQETVAILGDLRASGLHRLFALSNWSQEKFPVAEKRFAFLKWFEGLVVSGRLGFKKPDVRIFNYLCTTYDLRPKECLFIDDVVGNIRAAEALGFVAIHFQTAQQLRFELKSLGLL